MEDKEMSLGIMKYVTGTDDPGAESFRKYLDASLTSANSGAMTTDFPHVKWTPFVERLSDAMRYGADSDAEIVNLELGIQSIDASIEKTAEKYIELVKQHNHLVDKLASITGNRVLIQAESLHKYAEVKSIQKELPNGVGEEGTLLKSFDNKLVESFLKASRYPDFKMKCYVHPQDYQQLQREAIDLSYSFPGTLTSSSPFIYRGVEVLPAYHQKTGEFDFVLSLNL